jgi:hypothetical protein
MAQVFLSYSKADHFFAELAKIKLEEQGISVWLDNGQLRAGNDWRNGIDKGISECFAVLLALSDNSSSSSYVTYEWASAMGKGKPIIPVLLDECSVHPKIEPIQYLDFSKPGSLPWNDLIGRIKEMEQDNETPDDEPAAQIGNDTDEAPDESDPVVESILSYLNSRGYQMISFEMVRRRIDENLTDEKLEALIKNNSKTFRRAKLKGGKPGMAKL